MFVLNHHLCVLLCIIGMFAPDEATQQCKPSVAFHHAQDVVIDGFFIAKINVENRASCSHRCYLEPRCLSHNYQNDNTAKTNDQNCQLSSSTLDRHPKLAKKRPGWSYSKLEVLDKDKVKVKRDIDDCYLSPCRNEGTCIDGDDSYKCSCKPGYIGKHCTTNVDDCSPNPCKNGGTCTDGVNSYNCSCKPRYNGTNCEEFTCSSTHSLGASHGGRIPNSSFSATSIYSSSYMAEYGRLQSGKCGWSPKVNTAIGTRYLQIDLGELFLVCGVATQGENCFSRNEWTTKYKISLSHDNAKWNIYKWNGSDKIFDGNTDCCKVKDNVLPEPAKARYIRFIPTESHGEPVLRVDVFGWKV